MAKQDRTDWLDPKEDVTADNGHVTSASPEYDSPVIETKPKAEPLKHKPAKQAKHRK